MSSCTSTKSAVQSAQGCGCGDAIVFDGASPAYRRVLAWVIGINIIGFVAVAIGSWCSQSMSLAANTLDFGADAATYSLSLWAIGRSVGVRSGAALVKGAVLGLVALTILGAAVWRALHGATPNPGAISALGLFGVGANLAAALLLARYREGDANVRSVWLCTRNDVIQCLAVAVTGAAVWLTGSRWPDLLVAAVLAAIFLRSAWQIAAQARRELRNNASPAVAAEPSFSSAPLRRSS